MVNQNNNGNRGQQNMGGNNSVNKSGQQDQMNKKNAGSSNIGGQSTDKKNLSDRDNVSGQQQE